MTTKEKILRSSLKLFAKQGVDKTSTAQITKDVGVASGTLFVHFKTKQDLIDALYIQIKQEAFGPLAEPLKAQESVEKSIHMVSRTIIEYFLSHQNAFVFMELVDRDPQISDAARKAGAKAYEHLSNAMKTWEKQGAFKKMPLDMICSLIWSTLSSIIRYLHDHKNKHVQQVHLDAVWQVVKK